PRRAAQHMERRDVVRGRDRPDRPGRTRRAELVLLVRRGGRTHRRGCVRRDARLDGRFGLKEGSRDAEVHLPASHAFRAITAYAVPALLMEWPESQLSEWVNQRPEARWLLFSHATPLRTASLVAGTSACRRT